MDVFCKASVEQSSFDLTYLLKDVANTSDINNTIIVVMETHTHTHTDNYLSFYPHLVRMK